MPNTDSDVRPAEALAFPKHLSAKFGFKLPLAAVLAVLVTLPLFALLVTSFTPEGFLPFTSSDFSLEHYARVLASPGRVTVVGNTIIHGAGSVLFAGILAFILA